ncbi:MAG: BON domain-containing protein [Planctomycetota bacterium]
MDENAKTRQMTASSRAPREPQLTEEVTRSLRATGRLPLRRLKVSSSDGVVTLRGRVGSYYHKQMAQAAALTVISARQLVNEVEVSKT